MKKCLIVICAFCISGCSATIGNRSVSSAENAKSKIVTLQDKKSVRQELGNPTATFTADKYYVMEYEYVKANFNFWYAVPIVGIFSSPYHYSKELLQVYLENDKVTDIKTAQKSGSIDSSNNLI
jgi:hypothetical protein